MGIFTKLFSRRPPVPEAAKSRLEKDERELAWAQARTGQIVVATPRGLHIVGDRAHRLVGWHEISKATWSGEVLQVTEALEVDDRQVVDQQPWQLEFDDPGGVSVVLRRRVEASVAVTEHHIVNGKGVRIFARRIPGQDGRRWQFRVDPGTRLTAEERPQVDRLMDEVIDLHEPTDL